MGAKVPAMDTTDPGERKIPEPIIELMVSKIIDPIPSFFFKFISSFLPV